MNKYEGCFVAVVNFNFLVACLKLQCFQKTVQTVRKSATHEILKFRLAPNGMFVMGIYYTPISLKIFCSLMYFETDSSRYGKYG